MQKNERKGISNQFNHKEAKEFTDFIEATKPVDLPVLGKKISWFSSDGILMSRLDMILISEGLVDKWKVSPQWIGDRDISDHCPVWLKGSCVDWGPKSFKFNNWNEVLPGTPTPFENETMTRESDSKDDEREGE